LREPPVHRGKGFELRRENYACSGDFDEKRNNSSQVLSLASKKKSSWKRRDLAKTVVTLSEKRKDSSPPLYKKKSLRRTEGSFRSAGRSVFPKEKESKNPCSAQKGRKAGERKRRSIRRKGLRPNLRRVSEERPRSLREKKGESPSLNSANHLRGVQWDGRGDRRRLQGTLSSSSRREVCYRNGELPQAPSKEKEDSRSFTLVKDPPYRGGEHQSGLLKRLQLLRSNCRLRRGSTKTVLLNEGEQGDFSESLEFPAPARKESVNQEVRH